MKIAIPNDNGYVSEHFGHCSEFNVFEIDENNQIVKQYVIVNPEHQPGYLPDFLHKHDINTIITGGMGTRALALFEERGIRVLIGIGGQIDVVIKKFLEGDLEGGISTCNNAGSGNQRCGHHRRKD